MRSLDWPHPGILSWGSGLDTQSLRPCPDLLNLSLTQLTQLQPGLIGRIPPAFSSPRHIPSPLTPCQQGSVLTGESVWHRPQAPVLCPAWREGLTGEQAQSSLPLTSGGPCTAPRPSTGLCVWALMHLADCGAEFLEAKGGHRPSSCALQEKFRSDTDCSSATCLASPWACSSRESAL